MEGMCTNTLQQSHHSRNSKTYSPSSLNPAMSAENVDERDGMPPTNGSGVNNTNEYPW